MSNYHLAQLNIAAKRYADDDPRFADFMNALDPVNAVADQSPGFVWRLQSDDGNATAIQIFNSDQWLVNMSVWESLEALMAFVAHPTHIAIMRRRGEWFEKSDLATMVLWWVPAGHVPDIEEAQVRLELLRDQGPTPEAFGFSSAFPAPDRELGDGPEPARQNQPGDCRS